MANDVLKVQGKRVKCIYGYKATMNDELNIKLDDVIVLTQCSEDETWLEGTLNGVTGWFPSNYVQVIDTSHEALDYGSANRNEYSTGVCEISHEDIQSNTNETLRIKV